MNLTSIEKLGESAAKIVEMGYGYRDEHRFGEGYTNFKEVLAHETVELWNIDIYDFMQRVYGLELPYPDDPESESEAEENNQVVLDFVSQKLGTSDIFCKWVCASIKDVVNTYETSEENVTRWDIHGNFMVISDFGTDGVLIASDKELTEVFS